MEGIRFNNSNFGSGNIGIGELSVEEHDRVWEKNQLRPRGSAFLFSTQKRKAPPSRQEEQKDLELKRRYFSPKIFLSSNGFAGLRDFALKLS
jgi:hypothetical protein